MKPNFQVNLWALLYRLRPRVWLDLYSILFDNILSERNLLILFFLGI